MTAHLLEVHDGALPTWLAPTQVLVLPAEDDARRYAAEVSKRFVDAGLRAEIDARDATLGSRIRAVHARTVPYLAIVGQREQQDQSVSVRLRTGQQLPPLPIDEFVQMVQTVIRSRDADLTR